MPEAKLSQKLAFNKAVTGLAYATVRDLYDYARRVTKLLNFPLNKIETMVSFETNFNHLPGPADFPYDLVIYGEPEQPWWKRILCGPPGCNAAAHCPTSVLIARHPRWPLKRLLFVTRGQTCDQAAVNWVLDLAQSSRAAVTVLAIQPPLSPMNIQAMYGQGLADWLMSETPLGLQLRRLFSRGLELTLRFRPGSAEQQIETEIRESQPDLIILAADPACWWSRRLFGKLVEPLLRRLDRPVLVVKPI